MKKIIIIPIIVFILYSFVDKKVKPDSDFNLKEFEKSLALVPKGSTNIGQSDYDTPIDPFGTLTQAKTITVDTFYILNHEVSNGEYLAFINDLKNKDTALYRQMRPDTLVWRDKSVYCEPYTEYYFRHPAFKNYPVVGVTYEQAEYYCKWLTEKYSKEEKRKFKNAEFKLPTLEQWCYSAKGGDQFTIFPWKGISMQNKKGEWLANFTIIPQYNIGWTTYPVQNVYGNIENRKILMAFGGQGSESFKKDVADITAPVISYYPNGYGIYNMAGNVEEYVRQKGITKGGSWKDTGYYLQVFIQEPYDSTNYKSAERGFRFVMEIKK